MSIIRWALTILAALAWLAMFGQFYDAVWIGDPWAESAFLTFFLSLALTAPAAITWVYGDEVP